jgi:hypothetical protein
MFQKIKIKHCVPDVMFVSQYPVTMIVEEETNHLPYPHHQPMMQIRQETKYL